MFKKDIVLLVIDDVKEIVKLLKLQLKSKYKVITATSAAEALVLLRQNDVHVIISDQRMPDKTGSEFFSEIKDEFPTATRVIMTAYADMKAIIHAINNGNIFRYVVKPWDPLEFEHIIQESIQQCLQKKLSLAKIDQINLDLEQQVIRRTQDLTKAYMALQTSNAQFEQLSYTDELTQLYNRRYWHKQLRQFHHHFLRHKNPHTLLIIDIDFFKIINDTHGHIAGDFVLKELSNDILICCRDIDVASRIGGEEFSVILNETPLNKAIVVAERIREKIAEHVFIFEQQHITLTVSIGICESSADTSLHDWIKKADDCLYRSKQQGRNQSNWLPATQKKNSIAQATL